jgi:hypothetical protein
MEMGKAQAGLVQFLYNPLTTNVYVKKVNDMWEVEIYKLQHFQGSLEVEENGKIYIDEDIDLRLEQRESFIIEVK